MWSYRRRRGGSDAEGTLRSYRAEPRDDFVRGLSDRVFGESLPRPRTAWSRVAFAGAASTLIVGMFASFGGLTYAASGATSTYSAVKQIVVKHKVAVRVHKSAASAQYPGEPTPPTENAAPATNQGAVAGSAVAVTAGGTLPFTGISLLVTVLIGCALLALGLILRRRERSDT